MPFFSSTNRVILAKVETTYGVPPAMTGSDAILAMNATVRTIGDRLERPIDQPYFGGDPFVLVGKRCELDFEIDLIGHATPGTAAPLGEIYRACGHSQVLDPGVNSTYSPVSSNQASATIDFYLAGLRFRLTGARGTMDVSWSVKNYARCQVKMVGLLTLPTDETAPSISLSAFQTPAAIETPTWALSVGSHSPHAVSMSLSQGGTLTLIETSESRQVVWIDRKPAGELIVVKNDPLSTWNPWSIADGHTVTTITSTITGGSGKNVTSTIRAQLGYPEPTEYEGVAAWKIPFTAVPDTGDDEYRHVFS